MKIAVCLSTHTERAAQTVSTMLEAQRHAPNCETRILSFAFGSVGMLGRPDELNSAWPCWHGVDGSFIVFAGVPIITRGATPGSLSGAHPAVTGALSVADPEQALGAIAEVDGAFVGIWWSASRKELTVITDFLGMQPLYRTSTSDTTCFASELKAFTRAGVLPVEADAGAWAAMLYFGHPIGARTMLAGATRVLPAQAITFTSPLETSVRETWQWPARTNHRHTSLTHELGDALRADVQAYAAVHPDAAMLLSGGYDSRLILCLCHELGVRPRLLTQSHPDENADADARFGEAFARALGMSSTRQPARADYFTRPDYLHYLNLNEVTTPSLSLFIATVEPIVRHERNGLWQDALLGPALKFKHGNQSLTQYLESHSRAKDRSCGRVFATSWTEQMDAEFDNLLDAERAGFPDDAEGVWRFKLRNRSRLRTGVNPYQVFDTFTPPLTPGISRRFWELAAAAEPEARLGKRLYRDVFATLAPRGLDAPLASGSLLIPGKKGALLYHTQRVRAAIQQLARRPRINRQLRAWGLPAPFDWEPSRYLAVSPSEADLDDVRLNADWLRQQATGGAPSHDNERERESFMYWRAWHQLMRGDLVSNWE